MQLFTDEQRQQLLNNGENRGQDHIPVVKLFTPYAGCTWLLTEIDPEEQDLAFGLCDLGMGFPELGYVYLPEITELAQRDMRYTVERDQHFVGRYPLSDYAEIARRFMRIVTDQKYFEGLPPSSPAPKQGV